MNNRKKELIAQAVIKVLVSRFDSFPENGTNNRNAPFHEAFVQAFSEKLNGRVNNIPDYLSLSSWLQGLNTSLGQTFFETVAQILCDGEKKKFTNTQIYERQLNVISNIMIDLKNGNQNPSLVRENQIIADNRGGGKVNASQFTVDCFYETSTDLIAIELKSVRPNSGEIRGEKQKILQAKAVLKELYPTKEIKYYFGFPFDPTSDTNTGYDKNKFLNYLVEARKFIDQSELLIADEFWSFLLCRNSGVMQEILDIINTIATPDFMTKYNAIQNKTNGYEDILSEWYLFSEREIFDRRNNIDSTLQRVLCLSIFNVDGSYNERRLYLRQ